MQDMRMTYVTGLAIVVSALSGGCIATEEWTQQLLGKRQAEIDSRFIAEIDSRFITVETGVREQGDRVREQGDRLDKVEVRVDEVEHQLAEDRRTREIASAAITAKRTLVSVVFVPFGFDRADLGPSAETALATIVTEMRGDPYMTLDLEGTTDPVGSLDYNVKLSQRRVEAVKRMLVDKGIEPSRIISSIARGPVLDSSLKNDLKRRVIVKLLKSID